MGGFDGYDFCALLFGSLGVDVCSKHGRLVALGRFSRGIGALVVCVSSRGAWLRKLGGHFDEMAGRNLGERTYCIEVNCG